MRNQPLVIEPLIRHGRNWFWVKSQVQPEGYVVSFNGRVWRDYWGWHVSTILMDTFTDVSTPTAEQVDAQWCNRFCAPQPGAAVR